jgi:hypothetical protein
MSNGRKTHHLRLATALPVRLWTVFAVLVAIAGAASAQTPADDLAAQIRSQGFPCERPVSATRDARASKPDAALWIVTCRNVTYRITLVPDMAAHITKLKPTHH